MTPPPLQRDTAFDAVMRVRCSPGWEVSRFYGHFPRTPPRRRGTTRGKRGARRVRAIRGAPALPPRAAPRAALGS
eukprot:gene3456-9064_t